MLHDEYNWYSSISMPVGYVDWNFILIRAYFQYRSQHNMPRVSARAAYRHLSYFVKGRLIGMRNMRASYRQIAQIVGCSAMTAERVVIRWTQDKSVTTRPGTGPSRKTTLLEDRRILRLALTNRRMTTDEIRAEVTLRVWLRTVGNRLLEAGLRSRDAMRLPLTPYHRLQRLPWCRVRVKWDIRWHSVVFSDESRFCLCSQIDANLSVDDLAKGPRKQILSRRIPLQLLESWCEELLNMTTGRIWYLRKGECMLAIMWQEW